MLSSPRSSSTAKTWRNDDSRDETARSRPIEEQDRIARREKGGESYIKSFIIGTFYYRSIITDTLKSQGKSRARILYFSDDFICGRTTSKPHPSSANAMCLPICLSIQDFTRDARNVSYYSLDREYYAANMNLTLELQRVLIEATFNRWQFISLA